MYNCPTFFLFWKCLDDMSYWTNLYRTVADNELHFFTISNLNYTVFVSLAHIRHEWPQRKLGAFPEIQAYWDIRDEFHEAEGLLLFGERLVVSASLRPDMLQVIHEGHLGRDKCKASARVSLYWPLMGVDIKEVVGRCVVCQKYRAVNQKEPLIHHSVQALKWQ